MSCTKAPEPIVLSVPISISIPPEALVLTAAPPAMLSQRNVEAVTGIGARVFLELLRRPGAPEVTRIGKLRLVDRVAFLAFVRGLNRGSHGAANDAPPPRDEVGEVLSSIGHRRATH